MGETGSFVFWESYESERRRPGVLGEEVMLTRDALEFDRTMLV